MVLLFIVILSIYAMRIENRPVELRPFADMTGIIFLLDLSYFFELPFDNYELLAMMV